MSEADDPPKVPPEVESKDLPAPTATVLASATAPDPASAPSEAEPAKEPEPALPDGPAAASAEPTKSEDSANDEPVAAAPAERASQKKIPEARGSSSSVDGKKKRDSSRHRVKDGAPRSWFAKLSRANKRRVVIYPIVLAALVLGLLYCTSMPGKSYQGAFAPASAEERAVAEELRKDVTALAGTIGARNIENRDTLALAESYVTTRFKELGYAPERLAYDVGIRSVANVEVSIRGTTRASEIVVIGAHYDSAYDAPGADDNASGMAAVFALAKLFRGLAPERTIRFLAFANEEPPRFWTEQMGSLVYAKACRARGDDVVAMLSLETVGYYSDKAGSQKYPPPMSFFYPNTGDFIGFVGNTSSRSLTRNVVQMFRRGVDFPSQGAALPAFIAGVGWSDQWSFWQVGYPGVMVTDTAPFRNPHYHQRSDLPETLDYERFARVVRGLTVVVKGLSVTP